MAAKRIICDYWVASNALHRLNGKIRLAFKLPLYFWKWFQYKHNESIRTICLALCVLLTQTALVIWIVSQTLVRLRFLAECDAKPIASGLTCVFLTGAAFVVFTFQMYKNYHSSKEVVEVIVCGWRACSVDVVRWFLINRRLQEFEKSTWNEREKKMESTDNKSINCFTIRKYFIRR